MFPPFRARFSYGGGKERERVRERKSESVMNRNRGYKIQHFTLSSTTTPTQDSQLVGELQSSYRTVQFIQAKEKLWRFVGVGKIESYTDWLLMFFFLCCYR